MAAPLGLIINRNPDPNAVDVYALILKDVVVNMIRASFNDMNLLSKSYDYSVDITMQGQPEAGIGHTYNAGLDTFIAPPAPPIDYVENVHSELNSIIYILQQSLLDVSDGSLSHNDITASYNSSLNDFPDLNITTRGLMQTIYNYIIAGG